MHKYVDIPPYFGNSYAYLFAYIFIAILAFYI